MPARYGWSRNAVAPLKSPENPSTMGEPVAGEAPPAALLPADAAVLTAAAVLDAAAVLAAVLAAAAVVAAAVVLDAAAVLDPPDLLELHADTPTARHTAPATSVHFLRRSDPIRVKVLPLSKPSMDLSARFQRPPA